MYDKMQKKYVPKSDFEKLRAEQEKQEVEAALSTPSRSMEEFASDGGFIADGNLLGY